MMALESDVDLLEGLIEIVDGIRRRTLIVRNEDDGMFVVEDSVSGEEVLRTNDWALAEFVSELPTFIRAVHSALEYIEVLKANDEY